MDNASMTFTSLTLIVLLLLICVMFACHCLGPRAATWMRSNKEEKIGLSKNKLFHANGYMIHSGSEFLLSTSGSFKRFDTIDKDDHNKTMDELQQQQLQQQQQQLQYQNGASGSSHTTATTTTTPLWNLPQADVSIPPQPLRPAPAPNSAGSSKTVTFSFSQINELHSPTADVSPPPTAGHEPPDSGNGQYPRSCLRSPHKQAMSTAAVPQPLEAPPPPRLTSSSSVTLAACAIPRPIAKRQVSLQNGNNPEPSNGKGNGHATMPLAIEKRQRHPTLTRRNSSTNPFLCESVESLNGVGNGLVAEAPNSNGTENDNTDDNVAKTNAMYTALVSKDDDNAIATHTNGLASLANNRNPFYTNTKTDEETLPNGEQHRPFPLARKRSCSETVMHDDDDDGVEAPSTPVVGNGNGGVGGGVGTSAANELKNRLQATATAGLLKMHNTTNPFTGLTQRVKGPHMLQKTISEDFLFRKLGVNGHNVNGGGSGGNVNGTWSFGRCSLLRQDSSSSLGRRNSSQCSLNSSLGSMDSISLERAISCDSVNSDSSVFQCELDQPYTQITGYLCIGLHYDKNSITNEGMELAVSVLEAKGLICPFNVESLDTFVRIYLVPDHAGAMQTKIFKSSPTPSYNESFNFWLKKQQGRHSLWFHLYHNGPAHTLIGEAEMEIGEIPRPITTWIPLSDSRKCNARWGELMFSLSYLPTAERLTIVIVKARNLKLDLTNAANDKATTYTKEAQQAPSSSSDVQSVFVKVYLMNNEKKVLKKRTSLKRKDRCPIFNESMIFSVPPHSLTTVQLRLTVFGVVDGAIVPLGHVIAGSCAVGKGLRHWHQMLSSLRKPVAMWHVLRRAINQPIFTGGAEAVVAAMQSTAALQRAKRNSIV